MPYKVEGACSFLRALCMITVEIAASLIDRGFEGLIAEVIAHRLD
jgi:hypothetical protein